MGEKIRAIRPLVVVIEVGADRPPYVFYPLTAYQFIVLLVLLGLLVFT
jgi:hypothetical protein